MQEKSVWQMPVAWISTSTSSARIWSRVISSSFGSTFISRETRACVVNGMVCKEGIGYLEGIVGIQEAI